MNVNLLNRCKIVECDSDNTNYWPQWLENAVPFGNDNEPAKCLRYQFVDEFINDGSNSTIDDDHRQQHCTNEASFNRSEVIECSEFVYEPGEVTILQEVHIY